MSTSSPEGIHANHSVPQDNDEEKTILDTSGPSSETPLASYDRDTHSWRMFGVISLWEDCPLLETLPPSGMTRSGALFRRPAWEPITGATDSLLWPTPLASGSTSNVNGKFRNPTLLDAVRMWPTPRAAMEETRNHTVYRRSLDKPQNLENRLSTLDPSLVGGKLNPTWVEWLMGFPLGWTDLEDSETPSSPK